MNYRQVLKYIITSAILLLILSNINLHALQDEMKNIDMVPASISLLLIMLQILFLNVRWHLLLHKYNEGIRFHLSSIINIAGYFANILFITSIGGIVTKSGLAFRQGLSLSEAFFATIIDRIMTVIALLVFCVIGMPLLYTFLSGQLLKILMIFGLCSLITTFVLVLFFKKEWPSPFHKLQKQKDAIFDLLITFLCDGKMLFNLLFISILAQGCFILSVYVLSINSDVLNSGNISEFFALLPFLILISSLPISLGGWGVREGAFIYGLGLIGFSFESAFLVSVQIGLITLIAPLIVGFPYLIKSDLKDLLYANKARTSKYEA